MNKSLMGLHVAVVGNPIDGTGENTHCILVERADIDALIRALEERK